MNAQLKPAVEPARPCLEAYRAYRQRLADLQAQREQPARQVAVADRAIRRASEPTGELEQLRARRKSLLADQFLGKPVANLADIELAIDETELVIASQRVEGEAAAAAHEVLQAQLGALDQKLAQERQRGPMLLHALHREAIVELIPDLACAIEPAMAVWAQILAHGDAADALRTGPDAGLPATAIGVQREFGIARLLNLPAFDALIPLLAAAQARAQAQAQEYLAKWAGA